MDQKSSKLPRSDRPYTQLSKYINSQWKPWRIGYVSGAFSVVLALVAFLISLKPFGWENALMLASQGAWLAFLLFIEAAIILVLSQHSERTEQLIDVCVPWLQAKVEAGEFDEPDLESIEQRAPNSQNAVTARTILQALGVGLLFTIVQQNLGTQIHFAILLVELLVLFALLGNLVLELFRGSTANQISEIMIEFRREQKKARLQAEAQPASAETSDTVKSKPLVLTETPKLEERAEDIKASKPIETGDLSSAHNNGSH